MDLINNEVNEDLRCNERRKGGGSADARAEESIRALKSALHDTVHSTIKVSIDACWPRLLAIETKRVY